MGMESRNPATGEVFAEYPVMGSAAWREVVARVNTAFTLWRETDFEQRGQLLRALAALLRERRGDLGQLMTREMGKPITQARAEVDKCAWVCDYYADHGTGFLEKQEVETDARRSFVAFEPLGPVLAVMPWNLAYPSAASA